MKKDKIQKLFVGLAVLLMILQIIYRQVKWSNLNYGIYIRWAEYVLAILIMIVSILYVKDESPKLVKTLLILYVILIILFIVLESLGFIR